MLDLLILVPILLAMLAITLYKRHSSYIALAGSIVSLAMLPFITTGTQNVNWFAVGNFTIYLSTYVSGLNLMLLTIVLAFGSVVFFYSVGFMNVRSEQRRFYLEMLIFESAMAAFSIAGNLILFFIAWEFLSVSSYLLIGFWYGRERVARAARKTISIVIIGDVALLAAIVLLWSSTGTLNIQSIISVLQYGMNRLELAAAALLIVALLVKSAQFPFHEWLADAMEGPTPVSAYLHSSTMVKAGVFAAIVLFPVFSTGRMLYIFLVVGLITAVIAMFNAMTEKHIKRVLAYSTIQELAIMFVAIGGGALAAAIYFFFAQSFYKMLLFFDAGLVMKGNDNKEYLYELSGMKSNKLLYITALFGVLSLAGFVPFDGFFANVMLGSAFSRNLLIYIVISLVGLGTSFYIFRWFFLPQKEAKESISFKLLPKSSLYAAVIAMLLLFVASFGYLLLAPLIHFGFLSINMLNAIIETLAVGIGAFVAYEAYEKKKINIKDSITRLAYSSELMNKIYFYITIFFYMLGEGVTMFDFYLNDAFDYIGHVTMLSGTYARKLAYGEVWLYSALVVLGLALLLVYVLMIL